MRDAHAMRRGSSFTIRQNQSSNEICNGKQIIRSNFDAVHLQWFFRNLLPAPTALFR